MTDVSIPEDAAPDTAHGADMRDRILAAASKLVADGGVDAATTRAVAAAAGVQAPTIYRLFGDKQGLLDALAEFELSAYVAAKSGKADPVDPIEGLRDGWDGHIAFCLANPGIFAILAGDSHGNSASARAGREVLRRRMERVARAGALTTSVDRATDLWNAAGMGTVFTLMAQPAASRDMSLSTTMRDAMLDAVVARREPRRDSGPRPAASELRASLDEVEGLSQGERHLLAEWLDRISKA